MNLHNPVRQKTAYTTWTEILQGCHQRRHKAWVIGDSLMHAFANWKEWKQRADIYEDAQKFTGEKKESLKQYKRVARAFPPSCRKLHIKWTHHQILASIPDSKITACDECETASCEQCEIQKAARRYELLTFVEVQDLDIDDVRELVCRELGTPKPSKTIRLKVPLSTYRELKSQVPIKKTVTISLNDDGSRLVASI